ncbi:MAG: hypothetical protein ACJ79X_12865, partial [Gemmatimonadaceae bacterium]
MTPVAVPSIDALQPGNPEMPPAAILMLNVSDVPVSVPDSVPLSATVPSSVAAVAVPDIAAPDCETIQVMVPGPVESDIEPEYVPVKFSAVGAGAVGLGRELPQAELTTVRLTMSNARTRRFIWGRTLVAFDIIDDL